MEISPIIEAAGVSLSSGFGESRRKVNLISVAQKAGYLIDGHLNLSLYLMGILLPAEGVHIDNERRSSLIWFWDRNDVTPAFRRLGVVEKMRNMPEAEM
jgi:hypothetical protein